MKTLFSWLNIWLLLLVGGGHFSMAQTVSKTYTADNATIFPSPERGMWLARYPIEPGAFSPLQKDDLINNGRLKNRTLIHCRYIISDYRSQDLDARVLDQFRNDLAACREAGVKMVPLFMYNHGNGYGEGNDDAPKDRVLRHLDQLGAVMRDNGDVIAYLGGGFIGQWGEWHHSTNNLIGDCVADINANGKEIINKMFAVLPANRAIVFRMTAQMQSMFGTQALASGEAFNGTNKARAGFKNHYFMGINNDNEGWATIRRESNGACSWDMSAAAIAREKAYVHQQCSYTPAEAEPDTDVDAATDPRHAGANAIEQLKVQRISTCNPQYNPNILNRWKSDGVYDEIERNLGYRFQLTAATLPQQAAPGSAATVSFTVKNVGYAAPYNPHGLELVLRSGSNVRRLALAADPRRWLPENSEITVTESVALPTDLPAGQYELLLNLPDPMASLNTRPEYAIRLANQDTWEAATGYNKLGHTLTVGGTTPPATATYYFVRNRWQGTYLSDSNGRVSYASTASGDAYQWSLETAGGYTQFRNKATGRMMLLDTNEDQLWCAETQPEWWSKDWTVETMADGFKRIRNRWQNDQYLHVGNLLGYPEHTSVPITSWSSHWSIDPVTSTSLTAVAPVAPSAASLSAFPNPSPDGRPTLELQSAAAARATVYVFNQQGTMVSLLTVPVRAGQTEFRLPAKLAPGTYHLRATLNGAAHTFTLKVE